MVRRTLRPKGVWCKRKVPIVTIPYLFAEIKEIGYEHYHCFLWHRVSDLAGSRD
jgi:hypothetical protein